VQNATFPDLRHTIVTDTRRAGIDYCRIMALTGQTTMAVFKRDHTVDEAELRDAMRSLESTPATNVLEHTGSSPQVSENPHGADVAQPAEQLIRNQ
jgi:hypothetical protein